MLLYIYLLLHYRVGRLILVIALLQILFFVFIQTSNIHLNTKRGIALYGYSFLNITNSTPTNCLESCLEQCRCLSFQMCKNTECQLCSSTMELKTPSTRPTKDCIYLDFERYFPVVRSNKIFANILNMLCVPHFTKTN